MSKAIVRSAIEAIDGVSRTWLQWESDGDHFHRVLYVEVAVTDPEEAGFDKGLVERISSEAAHVLRDKTTMIVSGLRIVPKDR